MVIVLPVPVEVADEGVDVGTEDFEVEEDTVVEVEVDDVEETEDIASSAFPPFFFPDATAC